MRAVPVALCLAAAALAGPVEDAANAVLAAGADLKALAGKDDPDPWLVTDELIRRGKLDAAEAFARAAPRPDTERLPEYVASRRGKPDDAEARERLAQADQAAAKKEFQRVLDLAGSSLPSTDSITDARLLYAKALSLRSLNRLAESVSAFEAAAALAGSVGWVARQAVSTKEAGWSAYDCGDRPSALRYWTEGAAIEELRENRAGLARTIGNIGVIHYDLEDYPKALEFQERALRMKEEVGDRAGIAATLHNIGLIHHELASYSKAMQIQKRVLDMMEELGDRAGVAGALNAIGSDHWGLGDYAKALEFHERSLGMMEDLGAPEIARILGSIGNDLWGLGDYPKALEFQLRSLHAKEELGDRVGIAQSVGNIGSIYQSLGDYPKALEFQERSLRMAEELGDRASMAASLVNIGSVHASLGDYPRALEFQERSLRIAEELGDRADVALTLVNIGTMHANLGDYPKALELYERSLRMMEELGDRASAAVVIGNIGNIHAERGDYPKALEFQERSLRMAEELGDRASMAAILVNIGSVHASLGDYPRALEFQERSLRIAEELGDRAGRAKALGNVGDIHKMLGNYLKALEFYDRAVSLARDLGNRDTTCMNLWGRASVLLALDRYPEAITDTHAAVGELSFLVRGLAEEEGARARENKAGMFETGATAALAAESLADVAFFLESERAGSLLEGLGNREAIQGAAIPEKLRGNEAEAVAAESVAQNLLRRALDGGDRKEIAERRAALGAARKGLEEVVARIQRTEKAVANVLYPKADSLEDIRGRVREGEALVTYGLMPDGSVALVVTSDEARLVRLAARKEIDEGKDLAKLVAEPLKLPKDIRRVLVSPTGSLCYVPFCTLFPGREVVYLPSGTTYGVLLDDAKKRGDSVLALGDPDYGSKFDERELTVLRGGARLAPLPGSRAEAKAVGTTLLLGAEATEEGLFKALATRERWHAVHLACHGLIEPERPQLSSLALSGGDFLTVLEVYRSRIPADLVVLSACETAKGKVYRAEGVVGFVRAFMFAGAPRVLVSLWRVDDEATQVLMTKFYTLWTDRPAARALKEAQEFVRSQEKWKDPKYWAAWQLWGLPE